MKQKLFVLALLFCSAQEPLFSQVISPVFMPPAQTRTEQQFRRQPVGSGRKTFVFRAAEGNRVVLELSTLHQVDSLPRLDSLVNICLQQLRRIGDTANELQSIRVDAVFSPTDLRLHSQIYPQVGNAYRIKADEITQLKVEQDTLTLQLFTHQSGPFIFWDYYRVSFLVNRLADASKLAADPRLNTALQQLSNDLAPLKADANARRMLTRYSATYDLLIGKRLVPTENRPIRAVGKRNYFLPYVQVGFQYLYGGWIPSAGAGLQWQQRQSESFENAYALLWEPHFVADPTKGTRLLRNDFLTLRIHQSSQFKTLSKEVNFVQNFSVGYLVHRSGEFFRRNTFKFSVPGLQFKNVLLEPEAFFNRLLKNFSPSLKLTLYVE